MQTIVVVPHQDVGSGVRDDSDADVVSVLALRGAPIMLPQMDHDFHVRESFSSGDARVMLHEIPRTFFDVFGQIVIPQGNTPQPVQQYVFTCSATTKRARLEFEAPCHIDCYALLSLLRLHHLCGDTQGGLSVGDPSNPHWNILFLLDDGGGEHCISMQFARRRWFLHMSSPDETRTMWFEGFRLLAPHSVAQFRRKFHNA